MQLEKLDIYLERISNIFYFILKQKTQIYRETLKLLDASKKNYH